MDEHMLAPSSACFEESSSPSALAYQMQDIQKKPPLEGTYTSFFPTKCNSHHPSHVSCVSPARV
eukprot:scaffold136085_cov17-Tisochrysis_lutea.AAC.1